jgi:predicted DNA-binding helix-hairpin-helix protein
VKRAKFTIEEIVGLTMNFYKRNYIEGLFLSSGVARSSDETMIEMIEIARRLRVDHKFGGYIHLKAVAGCSAELLQLAGLYADRMSANIELPKQTDLNELAPAKTHTEIEKSMEQIQDRIVENKEEHKLFKHAPLFTPGGQSTQMIVGATPSSDRDIMTKASNLYGT